MTLHNDAATGALTKTALDNYLITQKIDERSTEKGNGTIGLTPLALAARNGHADIVKLLLDNGAEVDAFSSYLRTPLWIVTSQDQGDNRVEIVSILLKHGADAKYSCPNLHNGSTPLENELGQGKEPGVIQLLVQHEGTTEKALELAIQLDYPEIDDAMRISERRNNSFRDFIVSLITALILFILSWLNSSALMGVANSVFNKFQISGNRTSAMAKKIEAEIPQPKTKEEFQKSIGDFVENHGLGKFFSKGNEQLLEDITSKAVDLQNDETTVLGQPENTENLVKFALYQPVIYCDDSGSMNPRNNPQGEDRMEDQRQLVGRIAAICTKIVPDELGVHLRFINSEPPHTNDLSADSIKDIMAQVKPSGYTEIGTRLRERILNPLLYSQYNDEVKNMRRPILISIITDGVPYGGRASQEKLNTLQDEIMKCQDYLVAMDLPLRSVVFQISQIGSDPNSKDFLQKLKDQNLENVYITSRKLNLPHKQHPSTNINS
ncbi:uncharacterized protein F4807DRAFT_172619 [Annulohypoxylon truncatum]|uniref:uncharacterized protein n=1 Tax=Annulohypoxylon truncatum TaxID=327061 RepID=UPI0020073E0E|nr:uncharacterized protein F4807DRAFT_172619 [Annulohypoxylon truncatum]KAI1207624.1 hypothetical protein F4807DRAFT_172619 [Annulohypoxylon truncatum]